MEKKIMRYKTIASKAGKLFSINIVSKVSNIIVRVTIGNICGTAGLGVYQFIYSSSSLFSIIAQLGLHQSALKFIAEYRKNQLRNVYRYSLGSLLAVLVTAFFISTLFYFSYSILQTGAAYRPYLLYIVFFTTIFSARILLGFLLRSINLVAQEALFSNLLFSLSVLVAVGFISINRISQDSLETLFQIIVWINFSFLILQIWIVRKRFANYFGKVYGGFLLRREEVKFALPVWLTTVLNVGSKQYDKVIIGMMLVPAQLGIYSAAFTLSYLVNFVLITINPIFQPKIAKLFAENNMTAVQSIYTKYTLFTLYICTPILFIITLFGEEIIELTFGGAYISAYSPLVILSLGECINGVAGPGGNILILGGQAKTNLKIMLFSFIPSILLMFVLMPFMNINGVALAIAIGYFVNNILKIIFLRKLFGIKYKNEILTVITLLMSFVGIVFVRLDFTTKLIVLGVYLSLYVFFLYKLYSSSAYGKAS